MPTYEILVRDTRHLAVRSYTFCDYSDAMDFYCAEKRAAESQGLSVSKPLKIQQ